MRERRKCRKGVLFTVYERTQASGMWSHSSLPLLSIVIHEKIKKIKPIRIVIIIKIVVVVVVV